MAATLTDRNPPARGRRRIVAGSLLALALLTSCARFQPQPLSPADNVARLENRSLTNNLVRNFLEQNLPQPLDAWPPREWDLDMLTLAAFCYNPTLDIARAHYAVTQGAESTAAQRPNPSLNLTPGYDTTTAIPSPWIPLSTLDWPIETAGKRRHRRAQAAHLSEAARFHIATVAWQLRSTLHSSLLDLSAAAAREQLLRQQLSSQQQTIKLLEQQIQAGARAGSETLPLRIAAIKTRVDLSEARRAAAESRAAVAESLGVPLAALAQIRFADFLTGYTQAVPSTDLRRVALFSRTDVLEALAEYAASQAALQLEIARQYPDLRLIPGYQYDQGDNKWSLGLTLDLPILNQNQGPIAEAQARRHEAAARFNAVQARALSEIERATEALRLCAESLVELHQAAREQAQRREAIAAQVKAGTLEPLELLSADLEVTAAALAQLEGQLKSAKAEAGLEDAVQRPFEPPAAIFHESRN